MGLFYSSAKFIKVENTFLAILYYTGMLLLLAYVGIYQIWYKGGYQKTSPFEGAVDIKVKGVGFLGDVATCGGSTGVDWPTCGVYDMSDTSVPPQQEGAVFVATSFYSTPHQTRGFCNSHIPCTADTDCPPGVKGSGSSSAYLNGKCNTTGKLCEMAAWCPPEVPAKELNAAKHNLTDTRDFTIFFRVDGSFSAFDDKIFSTGDDLIYNYNLFYLSDLVAYSQGVDTYPLANVSAGQFPDPQNGRPSYSSFDNVVGDGTVIFLQATIMANGSSLADPKACDLDQAVPNCVIEFKFTRVDPTDPNSASFGYNFRYTNPWSLSEDGARSLTKVYGSRIVFQVTGVGAQFDLMTLTVAIGSGIGILSVAKLVCDFILQYLCGTYHPKYTSSKYEIVKELPGEGLDDDDQEHGLTGTVDKSNLLAESSRKFQVNGEDGLDEKVGCWKMCQVRMCC